MSDLMAKLYGGAIEAAVPKEAINVSEFRQVPDTQEVFLLEQPTRLDQSIVIDLLEAVEAPTLPEIVAVHLDDILEKPPAFLAPLELVVLPTLDVPMHSFLVVPELPSSLSIILFIIQLHKCGTDVLCTMNVPSVETPMTQAHFNKASQDLLNGEGVLGTAYAICRQTAASFNVKDWSLFT